MSRQDDLKWLILRYTRRLQKLKEQQAIAGAFVEPKILIEIEDIEAKIEELQAELAGLAENGIAAETPVISTVSTEVTQPQPQLASAPKKFPRLPQPTLTFRFDSANGQTYDLKLAAPETAEQYSSFIPPYDSATWQAVMLALESGFRPIEADPATQATLQSLGDLARLPETVGAALAGALLTDEVIRSRFDAVLDRAEQSRQPLLVELRFGSGSETLACLP